ncbi:MAG: hypothetical protein ACJ758_09215 [Actinomycetota bacterium]
MRVEFFHPPASEDVVGRARWDGKRAVIESEDDEVRGKLQRVFRVTPVVVDDASTRMLGASGETALQPGSLEWFRAAALTRTEPEGLSARIVPDFEPGEGWDPASNYRTFRNQIRRIDAAEPVEETTEPD